MHYPLRHISIRVPWHDTGWDGQVCAAPRLNGACLKLKRERIRRQIYPSRQEARADIFNYIGNRPLEPKGPEVEFFPMEEVLHEEVKVH
jgi:hypothetical protein